MEDRVEYKISLPKNDEQKSFKIITSDDDFKGSVYVTGDSIYINFVGLTLVPTAEKRRFKEVNY
jgi:hypothetical protein